MRRNDVYSNNICSNAMFVRKPQQYFLTDILFFNRKNVCFLIKHLLTKKKKNVFNLMFYWIKKLLNTTVNVFKSMSFRTNVFRTKMGVPKYHDFF
jgi:hypothetical protein